MDQQVDCTDYRAVAPETKWSTQEQTARLVPS